MIASLSDDDYDVDEDVSIPIALEPQWQANDLFWVGKASYTNLEFSSANIL